MINGRDKFGRMTCAHSRPFAGFECFEIGWLGSPRCPNAMRGEMIEFVLSDESGEIVRRKYKPVLLHGKYPSFEEVK